MRPMGSGATRVGKAEQRHGAVGLDFEDALHQPAGGSVAQALRGNEKAREAMGIRLEVGEDTGTPASRATDALALRLK